MFTSIAHLEALMLNISPNPSNRTLSINANASLFNTVFEIYNVLGKKVHESKIEANTSHEIKIQNAHSGIYMLKVYSENKIINRKIIVQ